jgi:hypothetical protein
MYGRGEVLRPLDFVTHLLTLLSCQSNCSVLCLGTRVAGCLVAADPAIRSTLNYPQLACVLVLDSDQALQSRKLQCVSINSGLLVFVLHMPIACHAWPYARHMGVPWSLGADSG